MKEEGEKKENLKRERDEEESLSTFKNEKKFKTESSLKSEILEKTLLPESLHQLFKTKLDKKQDHFDFPLVKDHSKRPIWVTADCHLFVETFCVNYSPQVYEFVIAISEPISRPNFIHEFKITESSLYAAVSQGLDKETIINVLTQISKVPLPRPVTDFISMCAKGYDQITIVLKNNSYYIESPYPHIIKQLLNNETISSFRIHHENKSATIHPALRQNVEDDDEGPKHLFIFPI